VCLSNVRGKTDSNYSQARQNKPRCGGSETEATAPLMCSRALGSDASALDSDNVRLPPQTALHVNAAAIYFNPSTNEGPYNGRRLLLFLLWTRLIRKHYLLSAQSGVPCCPLLIDFFLNLFHAFEMPFTTSAERSGSSYYNSHFNYHHFHEPTCPSPRRRCQGLCPSTG
jgi:hypothetical protein